NGIFRDIYGCDDNAADIALRTYQTLRLLDQQRIERFVTFDQQQIPDSKFFSFKVDPIAKVGKFLSWSRNSIRFGIAKRIERCDVYLADDLSFKGAETFTLHFFSHPYGLWSQWFENKAM